MKNILQILVLLFTGLNINGQTLDSLDQEVSPYRGINQLAIQYYGIEFSKEQRERLKGVQIEFIFQIDELGIPILAEVNGVEYADILDSLENKTLELEPFNPKIRNGIREQSLYFLQLEYPTYKITQNRFGMLQGRAYNEAKLSDFEYIKKSNLRFDMLIGAMANQFIGKPSEYLALGGGMKIDLTFTDKKKFLYGLNMSAYGNKLKQDYPVNTTREQLSGPPTLLLGAIFGKWFDGFNIQAEFNFAVRNVTRKFGNDDPDWVQFNGWSPGVVFNYPIQIGKESAMYYYGSPSLISNNINLHFGLRYLDLSIKEASGLMMELGVSYRLVINGVKEYKIKEEFLNR